MIFKGNKRLDEAFQFYDNGFEPYIELGPYHGYENWGVNRDPNFKLVRIDNHLDFEDIKDPNSPVLIKLSDPTNTYLSTFY